MRCEACEDGRCWECGRQSWCDCDCEGAIEPGDVDLSQYGEGEPKPLSELKASYDRLFRRDS